MSKVLTKQIENKISRCFLKPERFHFSFSKLFSEHVFVLEGSV